METEKKQVKTQSKFNLEKMRVAQLDNLHLINVGYNNAFDNGDDPLTTTDKAGGGSSIRCMPPPTPIK